MDSAFANSEYERIKRLRFPLCCRVVGIWHKHNNEYDVFSDDDNETNYAFSMLNRFGCVSIIVTGKDGNNILNCYHVKFNKKQKMLISRIAFRHII